MKQALRWVLLACILSIIAAVQANHQALGSDSERFFTVLNKLLTISDVNPSGQIANCFSADEKEQLWTVLTKMTLTGAQAGTIELQNLPTYFTTTIKTYFSS
jgi:hypothetical protein